MMWSDSVVTKFVWSSVERNIDTELDWTLQQLIAYTDGITKMGESTL